jgi:hypothetical protein
MWFGSGYFRSVFILGQEEVQEKEELTACPMKVISEATELP